MLVHMERIATDLASVISLYDLFYIIWFFRAIFMTQVVLIFLDKTKYKVFKDLGLKCNLAILLFSLL